jgi:hypothetical protein
MYEYYSAGNNVWQAEETLDPTIKQLKYILDLDAEINYWENYDPDSWTADEIMQVEDKKQELFEELYALIGKHLRCWWD